ncbi:MAG TPA: septal ring lytic transglycosylase RlpA family protein [Stellaceae bacterium]|jgi:hypothetical protein
MLDADVALANSRRHSPRRPIQPALTITGDGLVLGLTVLAKMGRSPAGRPELVLEGQEQRILALLAIVYGEAVSPRILETIGRASSYWTAGEPVLAAIALARAALPPLDDPERISQGLSRAEHLLADGLTPQELVRACGLDANLLNLLRAGYNQYEPRVPAGNARESGEWTREPRIGEAPGVGSSASPRRKPSVADRDGGTSGARAIKLHGYATVYNNGLKGRPTATGDSYDPNKMTAAVLPGTIPLKSVATVTLDSDPRRSVEVYVNDHGLYQRVLNPDGTFTNRPLPGRIIDLSSAAFKALTGTNTGKVMVTVTVKPDARR